MSNILKINFAINGDIFQTIEILNGESKEEFFDKLKKGEYITSVFNRKVVSIKNAELNDVGRIVDSSIGDSTEFYDMELSEDMESSEGNGVWHNAKVNKLWIRFNYHNGMDYLPESEQDHIEEEVEKGFIEGELNYYNPDRGEEVRGYWKLK
jgi:hypothetical protein